MMEKIKNTIESAIKENDTHLKRIERTKQLLQEFFPISVESFQRLSEEQIEHVDQFIYRFTKLQDSMGARLLPAIYTWLEGVDRPMPFLDILNRLEQLQIIDDVANWQYFRNLRNNLAHDYPESIEQTVETLNFLYNEIEIFESMYYKIRQVWFNKKEQ